MSASTSSLRLTAPAASTSTPEPFSESVLTTPDGTEIVARLFAPPTPLARSSAAGARGAVFIVPAMGVSQAFYTPLATWLQREGFHVATFDYRGSGLSRRGSLRKVDADIVTWAQQDAATALEALRRRAPGLPVTWVGHSLGGQIVPFVAGHEHVAKVVSIAAGSGYWRDNAPQLKKKVWFFWYGLVPVLTPLFGYFPGKRLSMVGDLPSGVIRQWRKWCMDPEYAAGAEGPEVRERYANVRAPITSLSFTDDEMMSERSVGVLLGLYAGAPRVLRRWEPAELGVARVGHFGFFRKEMEPLWRQLLAPEIAERA